MLSPLCSTKWNYATAAHLLNRAGFGGTPGEIEELIALGPDKAVDKLVDYEKIPDPASDPEWARPDPTRAGRFRAFQSASPEARKEMQQAEREKQRQRILELRAWWLTRMAKGPRPLQEKLTLFWHGHFATSIEKVRDAYLMWRQNETLRQLASSSWLSILVAVAQDPAMLIWLDQSLSRKEHPNQNFAREVMELFTLGEGHYTETDVTEAARAFTGWSYDRVEQKFVERPRWRDAGTKTVLGHTGNLTGKEVLEQLVAQPQAARFISAKLWSFFASDDPSPELVTSLATIFRNAGNNFKPLLRAIFRSEEFYADSVIRNQVKSPVQWLIGTVRMLERDLPPPFAESQALRQLGQDLFAPPNVKGWDGGVSWITTSNLLNRYNFGTFLLTGRSPIPMIAANKPNGKRIRQGMNRLNRAIGPVAVDRLFSDADRRTHDALITALEKRFLQKKFRLKQEEILRDYLGSEPKLGDDVVLNAIRLVICSPEFQLT
jgi:uncharacterized protein (DUF1800 family)